MRREEADGIISPVVSQATFYQMSIVNKLMHRRELYRRYAELGKVFDRARVRQRAIFAAQLVRDIRVFDRETFHMRFINNGLMRRRAGMPIVAPVIEGIGNDGLRHKLRAV